MTKRIVRMGGDLGMKVFKQFITKRYNGWRDMLREWPDISTQFESLTNGCFVFCLELPDGNVEALTMHKFEHALSTMVSKESALNQHMRYLTADERKLASSILKTDEKNELSSLINEEKKKLERA